MFNWSLFFQLSFIFLLLLFIFYSYFYLKNKLVTIFSSSVLVVVLFTFFYLNWSYIYPLFVHLLHLLGLLPSSKMRFFEKKDETLRKVELGGRDPQDELRGVTQQVSPVEGVRPSSILVSQDENDVKDMLFSISENFPGVFDWICKLSPYHKKVFIRELLEYRDGVSSHFSFIHYLCRKEVFFPEGTFRKKKLEDEELAKEASKLVEAYQQENELLAQTIALEKLPQNFFWEFAPIIDSTCEKFDPDAYKSWKALIFMLLRLKDRHPSYYNRKLEIITIEPDKAKKFSLKLKVLRDFYKFKSNQLVGQEKHKHLRTLLYGDPMLPSRSRKYINEETEGQKFSNIPGLGGFSDDYKFLPAAPNSPTSPISPICIGEDGRGCVTELRIRREASTISEDSTDSFFDNSYRFSPFYLAPIFNRKKEEERTPSSVESKKFPHSVGGFSVNPYQEDLYLGEENVSWAVDKPEENPRDYVFKEKAYPASITRKGGYVPLMYQRNCLRKARKHARLVRLPGIVDWLQKQSDHAFKRYLIVKPSPTLSELSRGIDLHWNNFDFIPVKNPLSKKPIPKNDVFYYDPIYEEWFKVRRRYYDPVFERRFPEPQKEVKEEFIITKEMAEQINIVLSKKSPVGMPRPEFTLKESPGIVSKPPLKEVVSLLEGIKPLVRPKVTLLDKVKNMFLIDESLYYTPLTGGVETPPSRIKVIVEFEIKLLEKPVHPQSGCSPKEQEEKD